MYADMLFTDPPYNVDYAGKGKDTSEGIKNDNLSEEEFGIFINKAFENMFEIMREGAVFYICSGWSSYPEFNKQLIAAGFYRAGVIIWVKNNASYGWNDYRYKHEWILVGKRKAVRIKAVSILYGWKRGTHFFRDTRDEYDVWEVPREHAGNYKHPTQKPVWLVEKALANSSERGWIVADLFGGAGCTLIACERLKRRAFVMEYDPKYVDVIIKRWEEYTGEKAECLSTTNAGQG
jgi:DNA modification methylase